MAGEEVRREKQPTRLDEADAERAAGAEQGLAGVGEEGGPGRVTGEAGNASGDEQAAPDEGPEPADRA